MQRLRLHLSLSNSMKLTVERFALGRTIERLKIELGVKRSRGMAAGCSTRTLRGVPSKVLETSSVRPDSAFTAFLARFFYCPSGDSTYYSAEVCHGERERSTLAAGRFGAFTGLRKQEDFQAGVSPVLREERETVG